MKKSELIKKIRLELERELQTLTEAALSARDAATHEESRSEDQHDTRGLEASYLAGAQAARAAEVQRQLRLITSLEDAITLTHIEKQKPSTITSGSVIELQSAGKRSFCLLSPTGGGIQLTIDGVRIQVITPQSPLGEALLGSKVGEEIEIEAEGTGKLARSYKILSIE